MADFDVLWTKEARQDLDDIADYIVSDNGAAVALDIVHQVEQTCMTLVSMPERGVVVPELRDIGVLQYRQLLLRPWRIFYRIHGGLVYVIAVVDSRRDLAAFLMDRLMRFDV
ncbi:MAG: type II toxin-antitoxin system RelE/ParE family toxin [Mariprofundaceae bacterium]|nr:type II toxin-antitoxin system RelE/ParE family toxin [Mariprofundaceae bacterium]